MQRLSLDAMVRDSRPCCVLTAYALGQVAGIPQGLECVAGSTWGGRWAGAWGGVRCHTPAVCARVLQRIKQCNYSCAV
jgi:hypothetical protein